MKIENIRTNLIKPYWHNPRKAEKAVPAVKASIERYGFNQPLVLDTEYVIIVGHARYKAMLELGHEEIPCIVADMPQDKAREYRIADNKTNELASWDWEILKKEIFEIGDAGSLESLQTFFPDMSLTDLIGAPAPVEAMTSIQIQEIPTEVIKKVRTTFVEMTCPHCFAEFQLDAADVISRYEEKKNG